MAVTLPFFVVMQALSSTVDPQLLRDYAETRGFSLGRPQKPRLSPDGKTVVFLRAEPRKAEQSLWAFDVGSGRERLLASAATIGAEPTLSVAEQARRERQRISTGGFAALSLFPDGAHVLVTLGGQLYRVPIAGGAPRRLGAGGAIDPKPSPDGKRVAFVRAHDLWVVEVSSGAETRLTRGGGEDRTNGEAEHVAQEEMERYSGYAWAPSGRELVYEEADARAVEKFHLADPSHPETPPVAVPYPRPGRDNVKVRLGVVGVGGGKTRWLRWDASAYPYLTRFCWPAGAPLTVVVQARDQRRLQVLAASPKTGRLEVLLEERDDAWLNLAPEVPRWLADGSGFLWRTDRDGGPALELRGADGRLVRTLVPATMGLRALRGVDATSVLVQAAENPTEARMWRVPLGGGAPVPLSGGPGWHDAVSDAGEGVPASDRWLLSIEGPGKLPTWTVHDRAGKRLAELPSVAEKPPAAPRSEVLELEVAGGRTLWARVTWPRKREAGRRLPVAVHVYGGPRHQHVKNDGGRLLDQWIADHGLAVVSIDGRGTPARGRAFERAIRGDFGTLPLEDQALGVAALGKRFPELDTKRVGIFGWSFGGYLAGLAVLRRPDVFKCAVAGAPVVDWRDYDTHYTERYLGLPAENARGYDASSLLSWAPQLSRPLLVVHGTGDDNVYFLHSLKLSDTLFRAGKPHELLALPRLTHMVPDPVVMERLWSRIAGFLVEHL